jgi:DNA polymerase-3 subunit epsilon
MRQVVFDTETTGMPVELGHRVIEIGCVELIGRRLTGRHFHYYLNPDRESDPGALAVHGLDSAFLADKPRFPSIAHEFVEFIRDAELIAHNAKFDVGFLDAELARVGADLPRVRDIARVTDTLSLAREQFPGQRNSLDALCKRLGVDNTARKLHGALLDAELLADVYLALTAGQSDLGLSLRDDARPGDRLPFDVSALPRVPRVLPNADERSAHEAALAVLQKKSGGKCLWLADSP